MPVSIPDGSPAPVLFVRRFGTGYAVLAVPDEHGHAVHFPVALGTSLPIDGYRHDIEHVLSQELRDHTPVMIIGSGVYCSTSGLPVIDVYRDGQQTFSEYFISRGWAVPDPLLLETHSRVTANLSSVRDARADGQGVWMDTAYRPDVLLTSAAQARTSVIYRYPADMVELSIILIIVVFFLVGTKVWYYQRFARKEHQQEHRRGMLRSGARAVGWLMGRRAFSHYEWFRPMPTDLSKPPPESSADQQGHPRES